MEATETRRRPWLTTGEAARQLGVSMSTVRFWLRHGLLRDGVLVRLEARRIGGRHTITPEALEAFLAGGPAQLEAAHA